MQIFIISSCLVALIFGIIGFVFSVWALMEVKAYKLSTHKVEFRALNPGSDFSSEVHESDFIDSSRIDAYNKKIANDLREEELETLF